jgi:S1-C subfamily serine protease
MRRGHRSGSRTVALLCTTALLTLIPFLVAEGQEEVIVLNRASDSCQGHTWSSKSDVHSGELIEYPTVTAVQTGSPAEIAGLQVGDTLVALNETEWLGAARPFSTPPVAGDTIQMRVRRNGTEHNVHLVVGRRIRLSQSSEDGPVCRPLPSTE